MLGEFFDFERWARWFASLDREFVFLLALPFVVAVIGLWSTLSEKEEDERDAGEAERPERKTRG